MKKVLIVLVHDNIEYVSDRSLREFLKSLSKIVRRVQLSEAIDFIKGTDLDGSAIQSLTDLLTNESQVIPTYYLKHIKEGSLEAEFAAAAAFLGVLAGKLLEKAVTDIATQNKFYIKLLNYLKSERGKNFSSKLKQELSGANLGGRFIAHNISITETPKSFIVNVEVETSLEFEDKLPQKMDELQIIALLEEKLRKTVPKTTSPKRKGRKRR
ncbi:hypothetical protein [Azospirillum argentinense]|uniref:hypothetical protein n=1 Tax=Azospirillum argentinense TaxID=2970906 RepID=UPI001586EF11|nr:hypothetical protein [Azospirillum argentinense]